MRPAPQRSALHPVQLWHQFFFEPRSTSPMVLVRVAWGTAAAVWALTLLPDIDPFLTTGGLRYDRGSPLGSWNPLDWTSWSVAPTAVCVLLVVAAVATAAGCRTRASSVVAVACMVALQRTNTTILNSGDLFLRQIGVAVMLSPCGLVWSLDARRRRRRSAPGSAPGRAPGRAPWAMRLLQLELAVGYLISFALKMRGSTWRDGTALSLALRIEDLQRVHIPGVLFRQTSVLGALTWSTLVFEATFIVLVWARPLRPWVLGVGVAIHLGIDVFLDVGFFSIAIWIAYLSFVFPDVADRIVGHFDPTGVGLPSSGPPDLGPPDLGPPDLGLGGAGTEPVALAVQPTE